MQYRTYPKTDLKVSEIGFGLWTTATGWWGNKADDEAVALLHEAHDLGITLYDAADVYGNGRSEEQLAKAFAGRRDRVVYATKFGYNFYDAGNEGRGERELPQDFSPKFIRFALEESLRRLQTDVIDLYQIHNARLEHIADNDLWALLEALKKEGKIRHYGVALGPAIGWLYEAIDAIEKRNTASLQIIWNMLEQFPGNDMIAAAERKNASTGFMIRVPHSSGMLEGKYTKDTVFEKGDHRLHRPKWWMTNGLKKIEQLRFLESPQRTLGQVAIKWLLMHPSVMTVLPNIYDAEQLREFAAAPATPELSAEELMTIATLYRNNFGVGEEPHNFKGTMSREEAHA